MEPWIIDIYFHICKYNRDVKGMYIGKSPYISEKDKDRVYQSNDGVPSHRESLQGYIKRLDKL